MQKNSHGRAPLILLLALAIATGSALFERSRTAVAVREHRNAIEQISGN